MLFDGLMDKKANVKLKPDGVNIIRTPETVLRSDMLEEVSKTVLDLLDKGYKPGEIALVSTFADIVTEYVLDSKVLSHNVRVTNIARKSRFIDNKFVYALITLAYLCHPDEKIVPTKDEVRALVSILLGTSFSYSTVTCVFPSGLKNGTIPFFLTSVNFLDNLCAMSIA